MNKDILLRLPFMDMLEEQDKKFIIDNAITKEIELNSSTVSANSCDGLILLESGKMRIFMTSQNGKEITLYHLSSGDTCVLSYQCMIGTMPFNIQVSAIEKSTIINIPSQILNQLQDKYANIKQFLLTEMSNRLTDVMGVVEQVAFSSLDSRIAEILLNQETSIIYKTHSDIASDLGTSREIVSRILKGFEKESIIELSRGKIKILDKEKLKTI